MECRFIAQSAPGTWPAFWTITQLDWGVPGGDELDIIEAYGGVGEGNPNHEGYSVFSHYWGQVDENGREKKGDRARIPIKGLGGGSYWSTTFHTYAVYAGYRETIYYFDDVEVFRHPTNDETRDNPHIFLINLAIGGNPAPVDLERYGNGSDMYVDYVRVYAEKELNGFSSPPPARKRRN
jgi:beta-glucanase (GH16 family)